MLKLFMVAVPLFVTRGDYILTVEMALVGIVRLNSVCTQCSIICAAATKTHLFKELILK
jgi:hypothetical protein